jgi:hypothetical protein
MYLETINAPLVTPETVTAPACETCGGILYRGSCFDIGACETADRTAVRHSNRDRAKSSMVAFTIRGGVD